MTHLLRTSGGSYAHFASISLLVGWEKQDQNDNDGGDNDDISNTNEKSGSLQQQQQQQQQRGSKVRRGGGDGHGDDGGCMASLGESLTAVSPMCWTEAGEESAALAELHGHLRSVLRPPPRRVCSSRSVGLYGRSGTEKLKKEGAQNSSDKSNGRKGSISVDDENDINVGVQVSVEDGDNDDSDDGDGDVADADVARRTLLSKADPEQDDDGSELERRQYLDVEVEMDDVAEHSELRSKARSQLLWDEARHLGVCQSELLSHTSLTSSPSRRSGSGAGSARRGVSNPYISPMRTFRGGRHGSAMGLHYIMIRGADSVSKIASLLLPSPSSGSGAGGGRRGVAGKGGGLNKSMAASSDATVEAAVLCVGISGPSSCRASTSHLLHSLPSRMRDTISVILALPTPAASTSRSGDKRPSASETRRRARAVLSALLLSDDEVLKTDDVVEMEGLHVASKEDSLLGASTSSKDVSLPLTLTHGPISASIGGGGRVTRNLRSSTSSSSGGGSSTGFGPVRVVRYSTPRNAAVAAAKKFHFTSGSEKKRNRRKFNSGDGTSIHPTSLPSSVSAYSSSSSSDIARIISEQMQVLSLAERDMSLRPFEGRTGGGRNTNGAGAGAGAGRARGAKSAGNLPLPRRRFKRQDSTGAVSFASSSISIDLGEFDYTGDTSSISARTSQDTDINRDSLGSGIAGESASGTLSRGGSSGGTMSAGGQSKFIPTIMAPSRDSGPSAKQKRANRRLASSTSAQPSNQIGLNKRSTSRNRTSTNKNNANRKRDPDGHHRVGFTPTFFSDDDDRSMRSDDSRGPPPSQAAQRRISHVSNFDPFAIGEDDNSVPPSSTDFDTSTASSSKKTFDGITLTSSMNGGKPNSTTTSTTSATTASPPPPSIRVNRDGWAGVTPTSSTSAPSTPTPGATTPTPTPTLHQKKPRRSSADEESKLALPDRSTHALDPSVLTDSTPGVPSFGASDQRGAPPQLFVNIALNEDLSCSYRDSKISSCSVEGVVQVQVKSDSPGYVPFALVVRDPSRHIRTIQENKKYVDDVSAEAMAIKDDGDEDEAHSSDFKFVVTVPKAENYFPIMRYKCSSDLRPVPIRVQTRVRLHGIYCRVALQISSNPANEDDLTDLTIIMAVPPTVKGETLTTSPSGGVWNSAKRSVLWCVAELGDGEKFQLQAQFEMEKTPPTTPSSTSSAEEVEAENLSPKTATPNSSSTPNKKDRPSFPVLVRCQCMYAQLSGVELNVGDMPDAFPADVTMKLARRFRLSHRERS